MLGSYEHLVQVRYVPFGTQVVAGIWIAAILPMVPIAVSVLPLHDIVGHVAGAMLGGLQL